MSRHYKYYITPIKYDMEGKDTIPESDLRKLIKLWTDQYKPIAVDLELYYVGRNQKILNREYAKNETDAPDHKIPIPYGRKLVNTVEGYMYKPGNIQYTFDGDDTQIREIFKNNNEQLKTSTIRTYSVVDGLSYELHYMNGNAEPRFTMVKASEGFMIYDYNIEPGKNAFVYEYRKEKSFYYDVYYDSEIIRYKLNESSDKLEQLEVKPHFYKEVPCIDHFNNEEYLSDIANVKDLIDAYDILYSDSMNEFDRFAWAYLKMVGQEVDEDDAAAIKKLRIFQNLESSDAVDFLTKDIPTDYIDFMKKWTRSEIHAQSFIPDIEDIKFGGGQSGVAMDRFIYIMEYTATDKEAATKLALQNRLSLLRNLPNVQIPDAEIEMIRNKPAMDDVYAEVANKYMGILSHRTILESYAPAVEDVDEEFKRLEEEQTARDARMVNLDDVPEEDEEEETEE